MEDKQLVARLLDVPTFCIDREYTVSDSSPIALRYTVYLKNKKTYFQLYTYKTDRPYNFYIYINRPGSNRTEVLLSCSELKAEEIISKYEKDITCI
jgi:hypothetical protein